jgi:alpha-galactosidase
MMPAMKIVRHFVVFAGLRDGCAAAGAQVPGVANTPPMGWNSWDAYGLTITEAQFRANVSVLKNRLAGAAGAMR